MSHVYLREVSSRQWMAASGSVDTARGVVSEVRGHLELPHLSKYLLLAAYLASYNPANTDKRFFSKVGDVMCYVVGWHVNVVVHVSCHGYGTHA